MYLFGKTRLFFEADAGANKGGGEQTPPAQTEQGEQKPQKTFTQDELNSIVAKERAKFESKTEAKLKELEEAEKLKGMSEAERQAAEFKKLQEKVRQYENEKLVLQFKSELSGKKLPAEIADYINVADAEKANKALAAFEKMFSTTVAEKDAKIKELEEQLKNANLRGVTPKAVSGGNKAAPSIPTIF